MNHKEKSEQLIEDLSQEIGFDLSKESFCILPFTQLSTYPTGDIKLCCRGDTISNIKKDSLGQFWRGSQLRQIQKDLAQGHKRTECNNCWKLEKEGVTSLREMINAERIPKFKSNVKEWSVESDIPLVSFELKLSNRCNLRCKTCNPAASNRWTKEWPHLKNFYDSHYIEWIDGLITENNMDKNPSLDLFMTNKDFLKDLKEIAPQVRILDFAGGEPLIDPLHYETLKFLIENGQSKNTTLRYSTNLTVLAFEKFNVLELWDQFESIELTVSIDGFSELNEYIREGTNSKQLETNIERVKQLDKVSVLKGATTLNAYNTPFIAETLQYIVGQLKIPWFVGRVTNPSFLDSRVWPESEIEKSVQALKKINTKDFDISQNQRERLQKIMDDTRAWISSELTAKDQLFNSFKDFTKASDQRTGKSYEQLLTEHRH